MNELVKIRDVSTRYDISARTLRYYEDMGLLKSTRTPNYAYRLYDDTALHRLEQILILRKLNISIRDIQRIFSDTGSQVVLEVLGRKVQDIDDEAALLHELKDVILEFIRQIEQADFSRDSDVKMLYEKARSIETSLTNVPYSGNPGHAERLMNVTEKLKKAPEVRIVQINPFRALTSGPVPFEYLMETFNPWQEAHNHLIKKMIYGSPDFLWGEDDGNAVWIWAVEDWVTEADVAPYSLTTYEGGLFAAAMTVDGDDDIYGRVLSGIRKWVETIGFELDERPGHHAMVHMLNPTEEIRQALGYHQLDLYVPIRPRKKSPS